MKTKLYAPDYYKDFTCIADKCRHSCCVGWEIAIDSATLKKYEELDGAYGDSIRKSISYSDGPCFSLKSDGRCPHLTDKGLCKIITEYSEDCLCDICRNHPRFYNNTSHGVEVGLGMSCEEACRIILSSDYSSVVEIGTVEAECEQISFDAINEREALYSILNDGRISYPERLKLIEREWGVTPSCITDKEWRSILSELEYLDDGNRELYLSAYTSSLDTPSEYSLVLERFLAYLIYRHTASSYSKYDYAASLGFSLFCERLLCSLLKKEKGADIKELARVISTEIEYSESNTDIIKNEFI